MGNFTFRANFSVAKTDSQYNVQYTVSEFSLSYALNKDTNYAQHNEKTYSLLKTLFHGLFFMLEILCP